MRTPEGEEFELSGGEVQTTNNRMELLSVIEGLRRIPEGASVRLVSDSEYVVKGLREWLDGWIARGWKKSDRKPVLNRDLWEVLAGLRDARRISPEWIRGHNGHHFNERCDRMAVAAIRRFVSSDRR